MIWPILFLATHLSFSAQISEEDVRASVLKHFPLIEQARLKVESEEGNVIAAKGSFDTKLKVKHRNHIEDIYDNEFTQISVEKQLPWAGVNIFAGHRQGTGVFAPYEGKFDTSTAGEVFAGLSLPLLRNFATDSPRLEAEFSRVDRQIAERELLIKKNLYVYKGLSLYRKWAFSFRKLRVLKELITLANSRQEMLQKRFRAGDVERVKLTDNERSIFKRQEELIKAELEFRKISFELGLYYRDEDGNMINMILHVPPERKPLLPDRITELNYNRLPQLKILELELEKLSLEKKFHENQKLPLLNIEAIASREMSSSYPYDPQRVHLGVSFELPFENRKASGKTVATAYKEMALEKRRVWLRNEFQTLFGQSQEMAKLNLERAQVLEEELKSSLVMAQAERKRWIRGDSDLFIIALREQDAADVEIKLLENHYNFHQSVLDARLYSAILVE